MPKLSSKARVKSHSVSARFTEAEFSLLAALAEQTDVTPAAFLRGCALASFSSTPAERLLLARVCKVESLIQYLFGGLFQQMNGNRAFTADSFAQAVSASDKQMFESADSFLDEYLRLNVGVTQ